MAKQLAVAFVLVLSVGCATTSGSQRTPTDDLIEEANGEGVFLEAPLRLSPQTRRAIREKIGYDGTEKARLLKVVRFISDSNGLGFQYQTQSSLTAEKAISARRGDCMSYANLLVALARTLDVPARFVRITQLPVTWEAGGRFFESSHMAVALGRNASWEQAVIVDFGSVHTSPWRFSLYDDVSDEQAFALFQNNVAVQRMLGGDVKSAEQILRFFQSHSRAPEIANNLSLVLLQTGKDREALDLLEASVERFPHFRPLFANAVQAARRVGDEDLARTLEARGRELLEDEPAWNFNEGMRSYHERAYSTAALRFEKALSSDPDNVRLLAWSARAHLAAGNLRRGLEQVEHIRSGPPSETRTQLLEDLVHAFPQIEAPLPVAPPPVADGHT